MGASKRKERETKMNVKVWRLRWYCPGEFTHSEKTFTTILQRESYFASKESALKALEDAERAIEKLGGQPKALSTERTDSWGIKISGFELTEFEVHP